MTFGQYLQKVSLGGLFNILVLVPLLPVVMKECGMCSAPFRAPETKALARPSWQPFPCWCWPP